jgi:hypothetical protein
MEKGLRHPLGRRVNGSQNRDVPGAVNGIPIASAKNGTPAVTVLIFDVVPTRKYLKRTLMPREPLKFCVI